MSNILQSFPLATELRWRNRIRRKRPSLRLIVSSATLDARSFLEYFTSGAHPDDAIIISLEGRVFPVEVAYLQEPAPDYVRKAVEVAWNINLQVRPLDLLALYPITPYCAARRW
jgi:ATP-dependent RNA helicase DDX35